MNKEFTLWLCQNFIITGENMFYYKFDFRHVKTKFSYEYLLGKFEQGKTKIIT